MTKKETKSRSELMTEAAQHLDRAQEEIVSAIECVKRSARHHFPDELSTQFLMSIGQLMARAHRELREEIEGSPEARLKAARDSKRGAR